jgi:hypothetical protein
MGTGIVFKHCLWSKFLQKWPYFQQEILFLEKKIGHSPRGQFSTLKDFNKISKLLALERFFLGGTTSELFNA